MPSRSCISAAMLKCRWPVAAGRARTCSTWASTSAAGQDLALPLAGADAADAAAATTGAAAVAPTMLVNKPAHTCRWRVFCASQ